MPSACRAARDLRGGSCRTSPRPRAWACIQNRTRQGPAKVNAPWFFMQLVPHFQAQFIPNAVCALSCDEGVGLYETKPRRGVSDGMKKPSLGSLQ